MLEELLIKTNKKFILTTKIVPNVGHALLLKTDFIKLSKNVKTLGTQIPNASIATMRSLSNLD